jgi:hypothetical protein
MLSFLYACRNPLIHTVETGIAVPSQMRQSDGARAFVALTGWGAADIGTRKRRLRLEFLALA